MFQRFYKLKNYNNDVINSSREDKFHLLFNEIEFKIIYEVIEVLKLPNDVSTFLCGDNYVTSGFVIPYIHQLIKKLTNLRLNIELVKTFRNSLIITLKSRFENTLENDRLLIATFLNPFFKKLEFLEEEVINNIKQVVKNELSLIENHNNSNQTINSPKNLNFFNFFDQNIFQNNQINNIDTEMEKYDNLVINLTDIDILKFWRENEINYPLLSKLVPKYFCIMASSTSPERGFSNMGRIITKIRSSILPQTVSDLMLLKSNSDKW
jgi:hypothetical protein